MADDIFDDDSELAKFQAVCPNCSEVFEIDEEVLTSTGAGWDEGPDLRLTCPQCDWVRTYEV